MGHKNKHPDENVVFLEFSKKCAGQWKTMSDKDKKKFQGMADRDKVRFDDEMKHYEPAPGAVGRGSKRKQVKDPNAHKRSLSAFSWFCNDERGAIKSSHPDFTVGAIAKELGKKWGEVDESPKSRYEAMAEKDKARYERDMNAYKKKLKGGDAAEGSSQAAEDDEDDDDDDDDE